MKGMLEQYFDCRADELLRKIGILLPIATHEAIRLKLQILFIDGAIAMKKDILTEINKLYDDAADANLPVLRTDVINIIQITKIKE